MSESRKVTSLLASTMKAAQRTAAEATKSAVRAGVETATSATQKVSDLVADPTVLANVVIASTAAQEKVNEILRQRGSIYRIGEVQLTMGLPPQVSFSINRLSDPDASSSSELIKELEGQM